MTTFTPTSTSTHISIPYSSLPSWLVFLDSLYIRLKDKFTSKVTNLAKMRGMSNISLLQYYVKAEYGNCLIVVITDIDLSNKNAAFWYNMSDISRAVLLHDVVLFRCKDIRQMDRLVDSIPKNFAKAIAFKNGEVIGINDY